MYCATCVCAVYLLDNVYVNQTVKNNDIGSGNSMIIIIIIQLLYILTPIHWSTDYFIIVLSV